MKINKTLYILFISLTLWYISFKLAYPTFYIFTTVFNVLFLFYLFLRFLLFVLRKSFLNEFLVKPFERLKKRLFFKIKNKFFALFTLSTIIPILLFLIFSYFIVFLSSIFFSSHIFKMEIREYENRIMFLNSNIEREIMLGNVLNGDDFTILIYKFLKKYNYGDISLISTFYRVDGDKVKVFYSNKKDIVSFYKRIKIPHWYMEENFKGILFMGNLPVIIAHDKVFYRGNFYYLDSFIPLTEGLVGSFSNSGSIYFQPLLVDNAGNFFINKNKPPFFLKAYKKKDFVDRINRILERETHLFDFKFSFVKRVVGRDLGSGKLTKYVDGKLCVVFISGYIGDVLKTLLSSEYKYFSYAIFFTISFFIILVIFFIYKGIFLAHEITVSLDELYKGTVAIQKGNFNYRISRFGEDQIAELAKSFNLMAQNISRLLVEVAENEKLKKEVELARRVQNKFFPKKFPEIRNLDVYGRCEPAEIVSGDFYNFFQGEDRIDFFIGDISGKGFPASLLMASVNSALLTQPYRSGELWKLIRRLNKFLFEITDPQRFSTLFYLRYLNNSNSIEFVNCGHNTPFLWRNGEFFPLEKGTTILGMFENITIEVGRMEFKKGDILLSYTDGVVEATDTNGNELGVSRLMKIFEKVINESSEVIVKTILEEVREYHSGNLEDDQTVLVIKKLF